jgi:RHS repeat-associated protein
MTGGTVTRAYRYNYDANNRLTDIKSPGGTTLFGFGYDVRGNTTSKTTGVTTQARVFDSANRMNQVTGIQIYRYDGLGRRVQTTDADTKTTFWMYSQAGQVLYSSEARRSQNISYVYLGNTQVATRSVAWGTGATTVRYQHTDALGSPVLETSAPHPSTGVISVLKHNVFSPWGETWGSTVVDGAGYTGHVMDAGTGLTYMQQRYYDPQVGRFLSVDPMASDMNNGWNFNRYDYAADNPYRFTDPDGRKISAAEKWEQRRIEKMINKRSTTQFKYTKANQLAKDTSKKDNKNGSSYYAAKIESAIASEKTITVDISATYTDDKGKERKTDADSGGGYTLKLPNGDQLITVSGNALVGLKDVSGGPLRDSKEDITAHEFLAHAIPHILGPDTGNGVENENKARAQWPGGGQREADPDHVE